jgi:hypothetical protein
MERERGTAACTYQQACSIDWFFGLLWRYGRVTPGWDAAVGLGRWIPGPVPGRSTDGDDEVRRVGGLRTAFKGSRHSNRAARS